MGSRRGLTRIEVVVVILVLLVVTVIGVVIIGSGSRVISPLLKDGSQLRGIHQSWLIFASEFNGVFPIPGWIRRLPVMQDGVETIIPGQGDLDISQNTTANLYSALIMQNYFSPQLCVGPTEPSGMVFIHDTYNWELYDPYTNVYWDDAFAADLTTGSNVSYAHKPLSGSWIETGWSETLSESFVVLGNRGPRDGIHDQKSITNAIHGQYYYWSGNIIFSDNHVKVSNSFTLKNKDNIFRSEEEYGDQDAFLTFTKQMTTEGPIVQWD